MPADLLAVATSAASNHVRFAGSVSCFTSTAIDHHARRSSPVVRSYDRHLPVVVPWLNFTPDPQPVQAERFSFFSFLS